MCIRDRASTVHQPPPPPPPSPPPLAAARAHALAAIDTTVRARFLESALPALLQMGEEWRAHAQAQLAELRRSRLAAVYLAFAPASPSSELVADRLVPALPAGLRALALRGCTAAQLLPSLVRMLRLRAERAPARLELARTLVPRAAFAALVAALGTGGGCALRSLALRAPIGCRSEGGVAVGDAGAIALGGAICASRGGGGALRLTELQLEQCAIGDAGAAALGAALGAPGSALRTLLLRNNVIGDTGALAIADAIRASRAVHVLDLLGNAFGVRAAHALVDAAAADWTPPPPLPPPTGGQRAIRGALSLIHI